MIDLNRVEPAEGLEQDESATLSMTEMYLDSRRQLGAYRTALAVCTSGDALSDAERDVMELFQRAGHDTIPIGVAVGGDYLFSFAVMGAYTSEITLVTVVSPGEERAGMLWHRKNRCLTDCLRSPAHRIVEMCEQFDISLRRLKLLIIDLDETPDYDGDDARERQVQEAMAEYGVAWEWDETCLAVGGWLDSGDPAKLLYDEEFEPNLSVSSHTVWGHDVALMFRAFYKEEPYINLGLTPVLMDIAFSVAAPEEA